MDDDDDDTKIFFLKVRWGKEPGGHQRQHFGEIFLLHGIRLSFHALWDREEEVFLGRFLPWILWHPWLDGSFIFTFYCTREKSFANKLKMLVCRKHICDANKNYHHNHFSEKNGISLSY